jgi:hypothetical protein
MEKLAGLDAALLDAAPGKKASLRLRREWVTNLLDGLVSKHNEFSTLGTTKRDSDLEPKRCVRHRRGMPS